MKHLILLFMLVGASMQMAMYAEYLPAFKEFKIKYNKVYSDKMAEARAFKNFVTNKIYIDNWNSAHPPEDEYSQVLGVNRLADLSPAQRRALG